MSSFDLGPLTRESRRPRWVREHPRAPWAAVGAVCLGAFMGQLDASIVTLSYPQLQAELNTGLGSVQWVSLSYLVVLAVLLVPVGRWADSRGRKLLYLYGFGLFSLASAACALAPSLGWLVAGRGFQAVGAALLQANSVALVVLSVPRSRVRTALGIQGAAQALGLALGPTLGGVLVDAYGWRSVFWVNVPIGVVAILAGFLLLPRSRDLNPGRGRDVAGFVLLAAAIVSTLLVLSGLSGMPLPSSVVVGLCVVAVATVVLFWQTEARAVAPLVDTSLLRRRGGLGVSLAGALLAYLLLFAPLVLYPSVFATWGMSTAAGGLVLSCLPAGFALAAVGANVLHLRASNRQRVAVGAVGVFACVVTNIALWRSPGLVAVLLLLMGAFLGLVIPANNATVMGAVPASASAVTGGMVNMARAIGTAFGVALAVMGLHLAELHSWVGPQVVLSGLAVCSIALGATTLSRPARSGKQRPSKP
ncbi:MAG: MFS transporter [Actinomycetota bacterium]